MLDDIIETHITGTQIAYYIVCKRKLWLFTKGLSFESFSDLVEIGKVISETSFSKEKFKEIDIGNAKIDFLKLKDEIVVHETKKSRKLEEAHIWQVKYYIYCLRKKGINCKKGILHYPKLMKTLEVNYSAEDENIINNFLKEIVEIKKRERVPDVINKPYCKKCAYYEFCFV